MKLFVFGIGYSAERFLRLHGRKFAATTGTVRSSAKAVALARDIPGLQTLVFDGADRDPRIPGAIHAADVILVSIAPGAGDPALAAYADEIAASKATTIIYLSTIGVYGGSDGGWIDEDAQPAPTSGRTHARVAAEQQWLELGASAGKRVFVLRLAGIYGPGRNAIANLRAGTARRIVRAGQVFNRIHVDDIAGAIAACIDTSVAGGIFNICDDEPAPPQDVVTCAAQLIGVAPPPETPFEQANMSPMALSFWANNKRVSNRRAREILGLRFAHPTYREGLAALARTES